MVLSVAQVLLIGTTILLGELVCRMVASLP
jgi:hypothetical protein